MCYKFELSEQEIYELFNKFGGKKRNQIRVNRKIANKKIRKNMGIKGGVHR